MLLDSNIIIYSIQPNNLQLREYIAEQLPCVSAISYVEVLGYHNLLLQDRVDLEEFFSLIPILQITSTILDQAVALRQIKKISLGDSLIAATSLVHDIALVTRNIKDFAWISGIKLLDPFAHLSMT
jgi:toxin FitB